MAEFTGERVIPGQVDVDLWNEHLARYAFASRLARNRRVLDLGCGSGYGAAELAQRACRVVGLDIAQEAIDHARYNFAAPNVSFVRASCTSVPFPDRAFDLAVAFEVVEHLEDWAGLLSEARRLLAPGGQFVISTPNKDYYAESRKLSGPNPFHRHEFDLAEFCRELQSVFPHVCLFVQNHVAGVGFQPADGVSTAELRIESSDIRPEDSHFFVAVCAQSLQTGAPTFVYLPAAGNVLREREQHIDKLEAELSTKNSWLEAAQRDHQALLKTHRAQTAELEERTRWAEDLDARLKSAGQRIVALQEELKQQQAQAMEMAAGYEAKIASVEQEKRTIVEAAAATEARLNREIEQARAELAKCVDLLHTAESTVEERTRWAQRLDADLDRVQAQLSMVKASRWMRLGRSFGVGPELGS